MHTRCAPVRHSRAPGGALTVRLACIRPAASVHPEPGSNSSLYYCFTLNLLCISGSALMSSWCSFLKVPCLAWLPPRWSCAGLRLSKNSLPSSPRPSPLPFRKRVQKYYLFAKRQALFSSFFSYHYHTAEYQFNKNSTFSRFFKSQALHNLKKQVQGWILPTLWSCLPYLFHHSQRKKTAR